MSNAGRPASIDLPSMTAAPSLALTWRSTLPATHPSRRTSSGGAMTTSSVVARVSPT